MKIAGYNSQVTLNAMKTLAKKQKDEGYTEKEILFFQEVERWHSNLNLCTHEHTERVERVLANGAVTHYTQCQHCGWGKAIKKDNTTPALKWDDSSQEVRNLMWTVRSKVYPDSHTVGSEEYTQQRNQKEVEFWDKWREHLASDKWKDLRQRVIKRSGGLCEGCLINKVEQVHHKTYKHLGNEFCFELIGLCADCHKRFHEVVNYDD